MSDPNAPLFRLRGGRLPLLVRLGLLALLAVMLMPPVVLVRGLIDERMDLRERAATEVAQGFGAPVWAQPPMLWLSADLTEPDVDADGEPRTRTQAVRFAIVPETLAVEARIQSAIRHVGIYDIPVFQAQLKWSGRFPAEALERVRAAHPDVEFRSRLQLGLADVQGLREVSAMHLGGQALQAQPLSTIEHSELYWIGGDVALDAGLEFGAELNLSGTETLALWPLAQQLDFTVIGDWPDPSFVQGVSPLEQKIGAEGFTARFTRNAFQLGHGALMTGEEFASARGQGDALRVDLFEQASVYQRNERVAKYALLFIGLTVFSLFAAEVLLNLRMHPLHYLLIGAALALFYLQLLAFSEHLRFALAYGIAAGSVCLLLGGYCAAILKARSRGLLVGLALAVLYGFLYVLVSSEQMSLLLGAVGLTLLLAATLYGTRRIDWYAVDGPAPGATGTTQRSLEEGAT
jgi:inner membrane protein